VKSTHAVIFLLSACCASIPCGSGADGPRVGGACEYRQIYGWGTIIDVRKAAPGANNCKDAVEVVFSFSPDDPTAPEHYRFADHPDTRQYLRVGAGMNPPRSWARHKGLVKGAVLRCIRSEAQKGTCTPVIFTFPEIDMAGWQKTCF
jgi:hypothetical protein